MLNGNINMQEGVMTVARGGSRDTYKHKQESRAQELCNSEFCAKLMLLTL
jgi:hypothetical protein